MNRYNDIKIGHIIYKGCKFNLIYRPSLKDTVCLSEWKIGKYSNFIIGDIFKDNMYNEDIKPLIYHELYHLYFQSTNEFQADRFACSLVGYDKFEECINKYCRKYLCDILNYKSSKIIYDSYCKYRLNAVRNVAQSISDIEVYKSYNLELI